MLSVNRLINVTVDLTQAPVVGRAFNTLLIVGNSPVISGLERVRSYTSIAGVAADFGIAAPEYEAAALYYAQAPRPVNLMIGRWLDQQTSGFNLGAVLTPAQQTMSNWTSITTGALRLAIDGSIVTVSALDFSAQTNLNGVAQVIHSALAIASPAGSCIWNGSAFEIHSATNGAGHFATGSFLFTSNITNGDTVDVGGTTITFVASSPVGNQVVRGGTAAATLANLLAFLQASQDSNISDCTYTSSGLTLTLTYIDKGTVGNSFTISTTSSAITASGATLSGGVEPSSVGYSVTVSADIGPQMGLTEALSQALVPGYAAETPVQAVEACDQASHIWYGVTFAPTISTTLTNDMLIAVSDFVEADAVSRMHGISTSDTGSISSLVHNDIGSLVKAKGYNRTWVQYSSTAPFVAASMFGRMFSVDFNAQNSTIELMYKQQPTVIGEDLTEDQANALQTKRINVYADYDNGTKLIQYGTVGSGNFIDETWGLDWFQNAVQTNVFNLLYTASTKIPQTDAGQNQLINSAALACGNQPGGAVWNGLAGPGTWNSSTVFGSLTMGQFLPLGYYIFAPPLSTQPEADRAARKAPPIQIALKLAGAFQEADVLVTVNQ